MKRFAKTFPLIFILILVLSACGGSPKSQIIGVWKGVSDDENGEPGYFEFDEERVILRALDEDPITTSYTLTESQGNNFILEIYNPEEEQNQFLLEGHVKNKNTIELIRAADIDDTKNAELVRVKNLAKDMKKEKEKKQIREAAEEKRAEKERLAEEKKEKELEAERKIEQEKEEAARKEREQKEADAEKARQARENAESKKERSRVAAEEKRQTASASTAKRDFEHRADRLDSRILDETNQDSFNDMPRAAMLHYMEDWDNMLNDVWSELRSQMPSSQFEQLKAEQNAWIQKKERHFKEIGDNTAYQREQGADYLASETRDRTYYLIDYYLE